MTVSAIASELGTRGVGFHDSIVAHERGIVAHRCCSRVDAAIVACDRRDVGIGAVCSLTEISQPFHSCTVSNIGQEVFHGSAKVTRFVAVIFGGKEVFAGTQIRTFDTARVVQLVDFGHERLIRLLPAAFSAVALVGGGLGSIGFATFKVIIGSTSHKPSHNAPINKAKAFNVIIIATCISISAGPAGALATPRLAQWNIAVRTFRRCGGDGDRHREAHGGVMIISVAVFMYA